MIFAITYVTSIATADSAIARITSLSAVASFSAFVSFSAGVSFSAVACFSSIASFSVFAFPPVDGSFSSVTLWKILCSRFLGEMLELAFVAQWIRLLAENHRSAGSSHAKVIDMAEAIFEII